MIQPSLTAPGIGGTDTMLRALVAEDDPHVQSLIRLCLEGNEVTVASTGAEACEELRRKQFDVVITDLRLPGLEGWEVARCASENQAGAFVIITTGAPGSVPQSRADLGERGVHATLSKPFLPREVRGLMEAARQFRAERKLNLRH